EFASGSSGYGIRFVGTTIEGNSAYGVHVMGTPYGLAFWGTYFEANVGGHVYVTAATRAMSVRASTFMGVAAWGVRMSAGVETTIDTNSFVMGSGTRALTFEAGASRTAVGTNYYDTPSTFAPATDYLGTDLRLHNADGTWAKQVRLGSGTLHVD